MAALTLGDYHQAFGAGQRLAMIFADQRERNGLRNIVEERSTPASGSEKAWRKT